MMGEELREFYVAMLKEGYSVVKFRVSDGKYFIDISLSMGKGEGQGDVILSPENTSCEFWYKPYFGISPIKIG